MHGRGYVNNGDKIAAEYMAGQLKHFKLNHFRKNYFQIFSLDINTFPSDVELFVDGKKLIPGKDFIVGPESGSYKGKLNLLFVNSTDAKTAETHSHDAMVVADKSPTALYSDSPVQLILKKKLTGELSTNKPGRSVTIYILDSLLPPPLSKEIDIDVKNKFIQHFQTQNCIGYIKGTQFPDSFLVFSAHYDHLGQMGKNVYFPGANDNASGCSMLLNLVKYYSEHPQKYSIAFIAFGAEEAGLVGSNYYVEHPLFPLKQIKFLVNLDLLGTGNEGITVVNGSVFKTEFDMLTKINEEKKYLSQIKIRGKAANSDHYHFSENGVKCFFIYTLGGIKAYHDVYDRPETLPLTAFENVFHLLTDFTEQLQK